MDQIFKCSSTMGDSKVVLKNYNLKILGKKRKHVYDYKLLQKVKLQDIWRTFDKIRSAIFRVKLNLWEYFLPFDKTRKNVMTGICILQITLL